MMLYQSNPNQADILDTQINWLADLGFNYTLTLRYHRRLSDGEWLSLEQASKTANHFMNRLDRALLGRQAQKKGQFIPRAVFHETDYSDGIHSHIVLKFAGTHSELLDGCEKARVRVQWIDRPPHIEAIKPGTEKWFIAYCSKDGPNSFSPVSSRLLPANTAQQASIYK